MCNSETYCSLILDALIKILKKMDEYLLFKASAVILYELDKIKVVFPG